MSDKPKSLYDRMRDADYLEEDAAFPEEWMDERNKSDKEKYFEYYDDIKLTPKDDWWFFKALSNYRKCLFVKKSIVTFDNEIVIFGIDNHYSLC